MACCKHEVFSAFMLTKYCWNNFLEIILFERKKKKAGVCSFLDVHDRHTRVSGDLMRSHSLMHLHQTPKAAKFARMRFQPDLVIYLTLWGGVTWTGYVGFSGSCGGLPGVRRPSRRLRKGYRSEQHPWPDSSYTVSEGCHTCWQGCRGLSAWVDHICVFCTRTS